MDWTHMVIGGNAGMTNQEYCTRLRTLEAFNMYDHSMRNTQWM